MTTAGPERAAGRRTRQPSGELTSLDERLGLLLLVRIAFVVIVMLGAVLASRQVVVSASSAAPLSAVYMLVVTAAEAYRRGGRHGRLLVHRAVLPLDAVYLAIMTAPSGGPRSPLFMLFAVQLISVTLLASEKAGLRTALWDTFLFVLIPTLSLSGRIGLLLGVGQIASPSGVETTLAVVGFWMVAACTAGFSSVSERELRRSNAETAALAAMASTLERMTEEEKILATLLETVLAAFPVQRGALWYSDGQRPHGLVLSGPGLAPTGVPVPPMARADRAAVSAWSERQPKLLRRLDPETDPVAAGLLPGASNVLVLPLQVDGEDSGLVLLEHGGHPLTARLPKQTVVMLGQFATHAALSLRNARLLAERERLASMDGLTGLANRREFDAVLGREVSRAQRTGEPLTLMVLDLDHFKAVNDTRGHLGGDEVLRGVAGVLAGAVREMDLVARYGGEEFAALLPGCDHRDAIRVAERIRATMRQTPVLADVTVSAGVATLPFHAGTGLELVAAADEALYQSKREGRDRWTVSTRPASLGPVPI